MSHYRDQVVAEGVPGGKWVIRFIYGNGTSKNDLGDYRTALGRWVSSRSQAERFNTLDELKRSVPGGHHYLGHRPYGKQYAEGQCQYD